MPDHTHAPTKLHPFKDIM